MDPSYSAAKRNMPFTLHHDAPVTPANAFEVMWCAIHRVMYHGKYALGPEQCISVTQALKAVTINSARQGGEGETKGSLEAGKMADMIVLSRDPFDLITMSHQEMMEGLKVYQTFKGGKCIFKQS